MPLNVAVQMDQIRRINIDGDSTFALMLEAQRRGHALFHYTPDRLVVARRQGLGARRADDGPRREGRPLHARRPPTTDLSTSTWC